MRTAVHVALLCLVLAAPAAAAHTAIVSADGRVRGGAGLLDEPTSTYAVTGLDLCFTQNDAARTPLAGAALNPGALRVVLKAPNGVTHTGALSVPAGRANCVAFETPLVLTMPGQYLLDVSGSINGTSFGETDVKAGGEVRDRANITFPQDGIIADHEAQQRIQRLESDLAAMQARLDGLEGKGEGEFAPNVPAAILVLGLAGVVALLRRR